MAKIKKAMALFSRKKVNKSQRELQHLLLTHFIGSSPLVLYDYDREDYIKKGYSENAEVYSIIKKITDKANIATPYIYVDNESVKSSYRSTRKGRTHKIGVAKHQLEVHKALDYADDNLDLSLLLQQPNELQTWREFITLARIFYFVQGESFIYRESGFNDCALSLHIIPSQNMAPIISGGRITGWKMQQLNGSFRNLEFKDVLHFKMPNPIYDNSLGHLRGMPPLLAGLKYLQLDDKAVESWIKSIENEGAKGLVSPNHPNPELWLNSAQVDDVQKQLEIKLYGIDNRNKIAVSGMPLQYTHIGLSPEALNIIKGLEYANVKLCDLWNVPSVLFDPNPTYENQKEADKRFVLSVILPYLNAEEDKLNSWLVQPFAARDNKKYVLDYDLSAYEELKLDLNDVEAMLKTHTINEVRVMLGSNELEEEYANQVFISQGMVPLSDYGLDTGTGGPVRV